MTLHVVGKIASDEKFREWEFIGVFDSEEKALAACRTPDHFIGSATMNLDVGDDLVEWPRFRYPMREGK
jgi:hypothetical protein